MTDLYARDRKPAPEWLNEDGDTAREVRQWHADHRAQINAEWNALADPAAENRREVAHHNRANRAAIDAEWDALPAWPVKGMIG